MWIDTMALRFTQEMKRLREEKRLKEEEKKKEDEDAKATVQTFTRRTRSRSPSSRPMESGAAGAEEPFKDEDGDGITDSEPDETDEEDQKEEDLPEEPRLIETAVRPESVLDLTFAPYPEQV